MLIYHLFTRRLMMCLIGCLLGLSNAFAQQNPAPPTTPSEVSVGMYLNDIQAIDLKLHNYLVDFYVWYRWKNPDLDPASSIEFVNHSESWSTVSTSSYDKPIQLADGSFYQVTHVQGKMSKKMDLHDYPFDQQTIRIIMEDTASDTGTLKYVVDKVSVNSELKLPGFLYRSPILTATDYTHQTTFGDPRSSTASTYSRLTLDLPISRPHVNAFMKNILPILLAVICCSLAFLLHPSLVDSRFQIAVVSLLSIVALQMTSAQDLPTIEYMTLLDKLYVIGYFYCIYVAAALTLSTKLAHIHDDEKSDLKGIRRAITFDRLFGFFGFMIYLATTLWAIRPLFLS
ncbi:MAG: hypothetical protein ACRCV6_09900 [Formosimonas sp.]